MGFKVGRTFELSFEGTDLDGAEVKLRSASIGTNMELYAPETPVQRECEIIAEHIIAWNLEREDGAPITPNAEGVLSLEVAVKNLILQEWMKATRGVTAPLDRRSPSGEQSPAEPMSMETL
jgi:hypothetical protein